MGKKIALVCLLGCSVLSHAVDLIYDNSNRDALNSFANVDPTAVMLDDVLVPTFRVNGRTTIDVRKVEVELYAPIGGTYTVRAWRSKAVQSQQQTAIPQFPPTQVGVQSIAFNNGQTKKATFGDGNSVLFRTDLLPGDYQGNPYLVFYFGLSFSSDLNHIGWMAADGPDANVNSFFKYYSANDPRNGITALGGGARSSFYIKIWATTVPEPATWTALLGLAAGSLLRRRTRA